MATKTQIYVNTRIVTCGHTEWVVDMEQNAQDVLFVGFVFGVETAPERSEIAPRVLAHYGTTDLDTGSHPSPKLGRIGGILRRIFKGGGIT